MTSILILDDHAVVRQGIKQILLSEYTEALFGEASSCDEALGLLRQARWDIVILDISLPDRNGLFLIKEVRELSPAAPILIFSMHQEEGYAIRALKAGASGYLVKGCAMEDLAEAVSKVMSGGRYLSMCLAEKIADELGRDEMRSAHESLSEREFQVFLLFARGKSVREIAWELPLSEHTVRTYRARILKKMKMRSNADMIHYAYAHKIVE